ncbi:PIG-L deacetylase family protein [Streptomyces sp. NPDC051639]|uniref:PIG-L deacetylase family protein n=1 Tax=Streptomyces sp. NPDC051639 TaxID=3155671 RepID=UPI003428DC75
MGHGSVLVIAPHPDDETFGCGGTIATLAASGMDVYVQLIVQHTINTGGPPTARASVDRGKEFELACGKLGVSDFHVVIEDGDHRDTLHSNTARLVALIESGSPIAIDRIKPQLVLLPARGAFHQDHQVAHQAAFAACRHRGRGHHSPSVILGYQCPEDSWSSSLEQATCTLDITRHYSQKQAAIECYQNQTKPDPHLRSLSGIERADAVQGAAIGVPYAESFVTYRTDLKFIAEAARAQDMACRNI